MFWCDESLHGRMKAVNIFPIFAASKIHFSFHVSRVPWCLRQIVPFLCSFPFLWSPPTSTHRTQWQRRICRRNKRQPTEKCVFRINIHGIAIHLLEFNIRQSSVFIHSRAQSYSLFLSCCLRASITLISCSHSAFPCFAHVLLGKPLSCEPFREHEQAHAVYKCKACKDNKAKKKRKESIKGDRAADSTLEFEQSVSRCDERVNVNGCWWLSIRLSDALCGFACVGVCVCERV